jgi:hypothetical protein
MLLALSLALLVVGSPGQSARAHEDANTLLSSPAYPMLDEPGAPEAPTPWLDEVRAQRQAWEERREATRQAYEARRRANNPRGAAVQEAWEEDTRRRRAARMERMAQDREHFRQIGPPEPPLGQPWGRPPWTTDHPPPPPELGANTPVGIPGQPEDHLPNPPGWDNLWYFRGF